MGSMVLEELAGVVGLEGDLEGLGSLRGGLRSSSWDWPHRCGKVNVEGVRYRPGDRVGRCILIRSHVKKGRHQPRVRVPATALILLTGDSEPSRPPNLQSEAQQRHLLPQTGSRRASCEYARAV